MDLNSTPPGVPAPNVMLIGPTGSGKTYSLRTLAEMGVELFGVFTEPGMEVISDLPADKLHWTYVPPSTSDWGAVVSRAEQVNKMSWEAMTKHVDSKKSQYNAWVKLVKNFANFHDERTGEDFGDVLQWGPDRALVLDSLSGLNDMAMQHIVGGQIVKSLPQWGAAMDTEMGLIKKLAYETRCWFILICHVERQVDEVFGGTLIQPLALGKKNAPEIPKLFSDVVLCSKQGDEWFWATEGAGVDLKARNLPYNKKLKPTFEPLVTNWLKRIEKGDTVSA